MDCVAVNEIIIVEVIMMGQGSMIKVLGIVRNDKERVYFPKGNPIKIVSASRGRGSKGIQKVEADTGVAREKDMMYYLGGDGNLYSFRRKGAK